MQTRTLGRTGLEVSILNFPLIEDALLPLASEQDVGVVGMKAVGDGFLWRSAYERGGKGALALY